MKKLYFLFTILFFFYFNSNSQDADFNVNANLNVDALVPSFYETTSLTSATWTTLPISPHAASRSFCAVVRIGDTTFVYQFGGGAGAQLTTVARFKVSTNTWTMNYSTMPSAVSSGTALRINDSLIYVFGGNTGVLGRTQKYNYITNTWTLMANMNTLVTDALCVKWRDSVVYVVAGGDGLFGSGVFNAVQRYSIGTNTYTSVGTYPISCAMMGGGIYGDTIISAAGWTGATGTANSYKGGINPVTGTVTWTAIAPFPAGTITRMASYLATKGGGVGIMCTGGAVSGGVLINSTNFWNYCTQTWQAGLPNNSQARSNFKGSGLGDSVVYVVGGFTTVGVGTFERITFSQIDGTCGFVGINNNQGEIPNSYNLHQNYPNPFNPSTVISYSLPKAGIVKLVVTDMLGKEIRTLVNDFRQAGNHTLEFNAEGISSGVYFYKITAGDFIDTKKMMIIK